MSHPTADLLQGTLDLLVLQSLAREPMHGWGISQRIQQLSGEALQVGQGSIYPALYRLQKRGLIKAAWKTTENNRTGRYYSLTGAGQRALEDEVKTFRHFVSVVELVLRNPS